jgi:hypothetical protein
MLQRPRDRAVRHGECRRCHQGRLSAIEHEEQGEECGLGRQRCRAQARTRGLLDLAGLDDPKRTRHRKGLHGAIAHAKIPAGLDGGCRDDAPGRHDKSRRDQARAVGLARRGRTIFGGRRRERRERREACRNREDERIDL